MENELIAHDENHIGEKIINGNCCSNLFKDLKTRKKEAIPHFEKAGQLFKLSKKWEEAAECFEKSGNLQLDIQEEKPNNFEEALNCYDQLKNTHKKRQCLATLIKIFENKGDFQGAGKIKSKEAEENEACNQFEDAVENYLKAADYYSMESKNTKVREQDCLIKAADLMCIHKHKDCYNKAPSIYEKVANNILDSVAGKSMARNYFFKVICLHFAYGTLEEADLAYKKFLEICPDLYDTLESDFIDSASKAISENNLKGFQVACTKYNSSNTLDTWKINVLSIIKDKLSGIKVVENYTKNNDHAEEVDWR